MCTLFNIRSTQRSLLDWAKAKSDRYGNLPPSYDVRPDDPTPAIRVGEDGERELIRLRWGLPNPPGIKPPINCNIRNPKSPHWRRWMGEPNRCIVPATSFCEYGTDPDPVTKKKPKHWFALDDSQPVFAFAGIWTPWFGTRKKAEGDMQHEIFAFFTTDANAVVGPIHEKAMPVILRSQDEVDQWLSAPMDEALRLQRPLPDDALKVIERAEDEVATEVSKAKPDTGKLPLF